MLRSTSLALTLALAFGGTLGVLQPVTAQVAPAASEVAKYSRLHLAAHRGVLAEVTRLIAAKAALNARNSDGRTPLRVATFARKHDVIEALMEARADYAALESDRYDAVTIASVADDEESFRVLLANWASAKLITSR